MGISPFRAPFTLYKKLLRRAAKARQARVTSEREKEHQKALDYFSETSELVDPTKPSFRVEMFRLRKIHHAMESETGLKHPLLAIDGKMAWRQIIDELNLPGFKQPALYGVYSNVREIDFDALPDEFVLKSDHGHDSFGVFPVRRTGKNSFYDFKECKTITTEEIVTRYEAAHVRGLAGVSQELYVEQLLVDPDRPDHPPIDWKLFVGADQIIATMSRLSIPTPNKKAWPYRFRWYDQDWNDLPKLQIKNVMDPSLPPPRHPELLQEAAKKIASSFPYPVSRVDLFDLPDGVYFGEVTANAGGLYNMPTWLDQQLGSIWQQGDRYLMAAMIKKFEELGQPVIGPELWRLK